jgi:hypothetical protein
MTDYRNSEHRVLVRTLHPRRGYPTILVFVEGVVVLEDQVYRTDLRPCAQALIAQAEDIALAYSPRHAAAEVIYQTTTMTSA